MPRIVVAMSVLVCLMAAPAFARPQASCSDYATQAQAQRAADTADPDGDGIYCESLPCPCSPAAAAGRDPGANPQGCRKPKRVIAIRFSKRRYPNVRRHFRHAVRLGWPKVLRVNRQGADARRERLLRNRPTRDGFDRDEYPPAVGRGKGEGLTRGRNPRGWRAHVRYVPSGENRSHGSSLGGQLSSYCNGTRFRYVFR